MGAENERSLVRVNGEVGLAMGVVKQSKANALDVARAVKEEVALIAKELPEGVDFGPVWDQSIFIENSIHDVTVTIFYAIWSRADRDLHFSALAAGDGHSRVSIPISVVGTFAVLYFFGYSINILTLMGLTLAIGLVVDDAIVVLENVSRWIEEGTPRLEATRRGMAEISFAVVAASVSVIAVFMPLAFMTGTTGRLFREFGVTVASACGDFGIRRTHAGAHALRACAYARNRAMSGFSASARARGRSDAGCLRAGFGRFVDGAVDRRCDQRRMGCARMVAVFKIDREFVPVSDRGQHHDLLECAAGQHARLHQSLSHGGRAAATRNSRNPRIDGDHRARLGGPAGRQSGDRLLRTGTSK